MKVLKLALIAAGVGIAHLDWKVVAGAFLGGFAAQVLNAVNLQRVAGRAVRRHEEEFHRG